MIDKAELIRRANQIESKLKNREPKVTVEDIAGYLGISKTAAHNTMWKMEEAGILLYVAQDNNRGDWYWLGVRE